MPSRWRTLSVPTQVGTPNSSSLTYNAIQMYHAMNLQLWRLYLSTAKALQLPNLNLFPSSVPLENSDFLCLQETHRGSSQTRPKIYGMILINELPHAQHGSAGSAIFARPNLHIISSNKEICGETEMLTIELDNVMKTSIYKPPNKPFTCRNTAINKAQVFMADFNSHNKLRE